MMLENDPGDQASSEKRFEYFAFISYKGVYCRLVVNVR
jgi:hypothetical protein